MKNFLGKLFSEDSGVSMMRVMSFIALLSAVAIAFWGIAHSPADYSGITILVSAFLSAAFGGKVVQKSIEIKDPTHTTLIEKQSIAEKKPKVDDPDA